MIVTDFEIDRFREGPPLRVLDVGNGLNVALVHSQGGHDLLLDFIPSALYGPDWPSYQSLGTACAVLTLRTEQGVFTVQRDAGEESAGAVITAPDGSQFDEAFISDLVDGVSPGNFREVFSFNLDRVGRQDEARILRMARFLRDRSPDLPTPTAVATDLSGSQQTLDQLAELIRDAATQPVADRSAPHDRSKGEHDLKQTERSIADLQQKIQHLVRELEETQAALSLNRSHARLAQIEREIAAQQPRDKSSAADASHEATVNRLNERIKECKAELKQLADEKADVLGLAKEVSGGGRRTKLLPQIEAMLLHEKSMLKEEDTIEQLRLNVENLEARVEADRMQQTGDATRQATPHELARLDGLANRLRDIERQKQTAEQRVAAAESQEWVSSEREPVDPEGAVAVHQAEQRLDDLRQQVELDEQMHRLDAERGDVVARIRQLHQEQLMPVGMVMVLGLVFVVGVVLIIWSMFMQQGEAINWNRVLLGAALAIGASVVKLFMDHEASLRLQRERHRLGHVNQQLEALAAHHAERGIDTETLVRQMESAENEVLRLQAEFGSVPLPEEAVGEGGPSVSVEAARRQLDDLRRRHAETSQEWRELLLELQLGTHLTPAQAREALAARAAQVVPPVTDNESQLQTAQAELQRRIDWNKALSTQARQLVKDLGHSPGDSLIEHFDVLRDTVLQHREQEQQRRELSRNLKRIKRKAAQVRRTGQRYAAQKKQAIETSRARTEQQRLKRQLAADRLKLLEEQRERLEEDVTEIRRRHGIESKTPLADFSDEDLEQRLESQQAKLSTLREQLIQQTEKRGQLRAELAQRPELPAPTTAWAPIVDKTKELAERIASSTDTTDVPHPRQTHVYLHRAATYLSTLSGGQFRGMHCPSDDVLVLVDDEGRGHSLDRIRREHYPNIYFSLWLARIEVYSDRGVRLPVILEDPLKVTETKRKKPLAKLLKQFGARGYQTLLVTDVEAHADLFASMDIPVADLAQREIIEEETDESDWPSDYFEAPRDPAQAFEPLA